ncbi:Protrudin [Bagarius yarrelli]|uniref:Protrudin n=1 Tax=Bagarius yarrelli TaxID=175774 RepID=A0A556TL86_BAGYA|nr:Protrudin [Bagarius yarrelli]
MQLSNQETPPSTLERTEPSRVSSKDTLSLDSTSDLGGPRAVTLDLFNMVVSYKRMAIFLEPVNDVVEVLRYLLRWRMPLCSFFCCVLLNILFITLSEVVWFSILLMVISVPAVLGYLGDRCQGVASDTTVERKRHYSVQRRELQTVRMSRQEAMMEVKSLLKQLDEFLTQACVYTESAYKVLYWESHTASSAFYGFLLITVCLLYTAPPAEVETEKNDPDQSHLSDRTPTPTSMEVRDEREMKEKDLSPGSVEEAEEAEPDDEFRDAIEVWPAVFGLTKALWKRVIHKVPPTPSPWDEDDTAVSGADYDSVSDNGLLSRNEPIRSRVSKLTEKLRKRVPTNSTAFLLKLWCEFVFPLLLLQSAQVLYGSYRSDRCHVQHQCQIPNA